MINEKFLQKVKNYLNINQYNDYLKSLNEKETHGLTINLKKLMNSSIDFEYVINKFNAKVLFKNDNFAYLLYDKDELAKYSIFPGKDPLYHVGLYYIQEPSAATPLFNVSFSENDVVLDLCASPGGKTCECLYNIDSVTGGFVIANEIDKNRAKILSSNIERMGFDNVIVTNNKPEELSVKFPNYFDKIIVDAPCSGEGMFRKSEDARLQWSENLVKSCSNIQKQILDEAYKMLKPCGMIIYSTCTFSREEDEENISYFLEKYGDIKLIKENKMYPFDSVGEGQYFAILQRNANYQSYKPKFPSFESLKELHVLRYGIKHTEINNGRKQPTHASTHIDNYEFANVIDLTDDEVKQYLHGDVIRKDVDCNGWCKVTYKKLGLGLGKVTSGVIKNHYPKGLRLL